MRKIWQDRNVCRADCKQGVLGIPLQKLLKVHFPECELVHKTSHFPSDIMISEAIGKMKNDNLHILFGAAIYRNQLFHHPIYQFYH